MTNQARATKPAAAEKQQPVRVNELIRSPQRDYLSLEGTWAFELDEADQGEQQGWHKRRDYTDHIEVPGCLEAQGKGLTYLPPASPAWAGTCDVPYLGLSWFQKAFGVSKAFEGKKLWLNFGGVATHCKVWLNDGLLGEHEYASIPFGFEVTHLIDFERDNVITVKVENRHTYEHRTPQNTHALGYTTIELRWSGIFRGVELVATEAVWLEDLHIIPLVEARRVAVRCEVRAGGSASWTDLSLQAAVSLWEHGEQRWATTQSIGGLGLHELEVALDDPKLWSDEEPNLYTLELILLDGSGRPRDSLVERFGFRAFSYDGKRFLLNGTPVYLRGEMAGYHWPNTVSPPVNREALRRGLGAYKAYGFNFLRHHTHFPSVEYLEVCDELGLLSQNELNVIGEMWSIVPEHRHEMWQALIRRDRNHPSVVLWCMGNEERAADEEIKTYSRLTRPLDPTRMVLSNSPGWLYKDGEMLGRFPVYHELRRAGASYADPRLKPKYAGPLRPWRILFMEEQTRQAGLEHLVPTFVHHTQELQERCRKLTMEEVRLNATSVGDTLNFCGQAFQGYELCTFRDSGSFMWGVVDDFFDPKLVIAEAFKRYNSATVLLWTQKWQERIFSHKHRNWVVMPVTITCSHYGKQPVQDAVLTWDVLRSDASVAASGKREGVYLACGTSEMIATDHFELPREGDAQKMTLRARLEADGLAVHNSWDFWVFPDEPLREASRPVYTYDIGRDLTLSLDKSYPFVRPLEGPPVKEALLITSRITPTLLTHLRRGGRALLASRDALPGEVTEWGAGRSEYPRGTIIAEHPLMDGFPNEGWCDIPFAGMIGDAGEVNGNRNALGFAVGLRDWPDALEPIIMGIPSAKQERPQRLGHLFEVKAGNGNLLVTTLEFGSPHAQNAATRYFLDQVLRYVLSPKFAPSVQVELAFLEAFMHRPTQVRAEGTENPASASRARQNI